MPARVFRLTMVRIDFNRLRQEEDGSAVLIASSVFLDVFNVFLLLLDLFGGGRD